MVHLKSQNASVLKIDEIGEIFNISMSSASTAVAGVLEKDVEISTLSVDINTGANTSFKAFEPSVFAEYEFTKGLSGRSLLVFKEQDIKKIVSILLQKSFTDEEFELDEVNVSAISEVLAQMMASCCSALTNFVGNEITASSPTPFDAVDTDIVKNEYFKDNINIITVSFKIVITGVTDSEFMIALDENQANELLLNLNSKVETEPVMNEGVPSVEQESYATSVSPENSYNVRPAELQRYSDDHSHGAEEQATNLNMIMSVPLQISVEIGRTKKQIKEILELTTGSIVELNKQAGSQVDVFVNGQLIASGEVVVVDDYYGVRISEILNNGEIMKIL